MHWKCLLVRVTGVKRTDYLTNCEGNLLPMQMGRVKSKQKPSDTLTISIPVSYQDFIVIEQRDRNKAEVVF